MLVSDQVQASLNIKYSFCYCRQNICSYVLCFVYRQDDIDIHTMTFLNCHFTLVFLAFLSSSIPRSRDFLAFIPPMQIRRINFLPCHRFLFSNCIVYCSFFHIRLLFFSLSWPRILSLIIFLSRKLFFSLSFQIKYRQILFEIVLHCYSKAIRLIERFQ